MITITAVYDTIVRACVYNTCIPFGYYHVLNIRKNNVIVTMGYISIDKYYANYLDCQLPFL